MKIPWYKRIMSYLTDMHVESTSSKYNEQLHVVLSKGRYQLLTPNAIYSFSDKYDNYRLTFEQINLPTHEDIEVLVLGLGLASIPFMLEKKFNKSYNYTCVEIDDAVVYLASKYVFPDLKSEIQVINADAQHFVQWTTQKYDMVCIDIFVDDKIPDVFLDDEFLSRIDEILCENGTILFNHLSMTSKDKVEANVYLKNVFLPHYINGMGLPVLGNTMMINDKTIVK
jgi:spermidine synthase